MYYPTKLVDVWSDLEVCLKLPSCSIFHYSISELVIYVILIFKTLTKSTNIAYVVLLESSGVWILALEKDFLELYIDNFIVTFIQHILPHKWINRFHDLTFYDTVSLHLNVSLIDVNEYSITGY